MVNEEKEYAIWSEGYACTGERAGAKYWGTASGTCFRQACINYAETHPDFGQCFDPKRLTFWGCRLFSNEERARATFG